MTAGGLLGDLRVYIVNVWPRVVAYAAVCVGSCPLYGYRTHIRLQTTVITTQPAKGVVRSASQQSVQPVTNPLYSFKCVVTIPHLEHSQ